MTDKFSKGKRSEIMSRIKNKDSAIELAIRKPLWRKGFRYRKNATDYYGKPDLVFPKYKTVVFIDSCFWHGCPKHYAEPASNVSFWRSKIEDNVKRDKKVTNFYKNKGWTVLRIWEHRLKQGAAVVLRTVVKNLNDACF